MATVATIPAGPAEVTRDWLSSVLGVEVVAATVSPVGTGQTGATYRVALDYATATELPATLIVKLPSQDEAVRERVALGYRSEHAFYTEVAHTLAVALPHCYHCDIDRDGADFVMLLADLAPAVQGDQLRGCSVAEAQLAARALAGLHGPRWCDPAWLTFTGATMPRPDADFARGLGELAVMAADTTLSRLGDRVSTQDRETLSATAALVGRWLLLEPDRFSLLHGDYRLDNLLFDPDRTRVTVVDWQTLTVGLPARDLAYFAGTSLLPDDRAAAEHSLVADYHDELLTHGVTAYDLDTCWQDYRLGMPQIPLITTFGFAFSAATERGDDMVATMLERGCRAIRELATLELIEDRLR
ncbi:aminoglycoside phosphotransferase [Mycolicibacterium murale]|jgi:aminoglycoside phosphotransferase (APT) family kinase protein|uniref:Aminoglycoside phosphotransferase n=1 Tax=Mycolicibacterium murale TaxID=182220 RepID=A0A7I9WF39_9MYCO|nr:phosphotransferase [Mycolicibacterium murale]MCV7182815.1 phosphotransferase [Mycolicibacterium murale]GFG56365.1 aminoglycoside phosphotransferase [Mycolicibacterium murale]